MIQVSVEIPDRPGELARIVKQLGEEKVDIKALYLSRTHGKVPEGLVRMIVTNPALAVTVLERAGLHPSEEKVVVVALDDEPGGLARALDVLSAARINLDYAYGFVSRHARRALSILGVAEPDRERASDALRNGGFALVDRDAPGDSQNHITAYLGGEWYW